jgi:hypothetical protein
MNASKGMAAALTLVASAAQAVTPCDRLVAYARGLPSTAWAAGDKALAPALVFETDRTDGKAASALEHRLITMPEVREALGVDDDGSLDIEHLEGTELYAVTSVQGTAHCYVSAFVRARVGREPEVILGPKSLGNDENDVCWTTGEGLARAFDTPVHAVHDFLGSTAATADFTLTPWTPAGWGAPCRAELTFRATYFMTDVYCGDRVVCAAAADAALKIAAAYNRVRESNGAADAFAFGPLAPDDFAAKVAQVKLSPAGGDFPTFGQASGPEPEYGGSGHILFPLQLGDHWYAAAVGHGGVGWREDDTTLLAIFSLENAKLTPLASFVITRGLVGLDSARVLGIADR